MISFTKEEWKVKTRAIDKSHLFWLEFIQLFFIGIRSEFWCFSANIIGILFSLSSNYKSGPF